MDYSKEEIRITKGSHFLEMIYLEGGGSLKLDVDTDKKLEVYVIEENHIQEVMDFLRYEEEMDNFLYKTPVVDNESLEIRVKNSGNLIIIIFYDYDSEADPSEDQKANVNIFLRTESPKKKWSFDPSVLLFLLIPIVVILAVAYWIRRNV